MKSCYITAAGYHALEIESRQLWRQRREVVRHLAAAAAEGDRSENAEYQYRKKQLRELDRRIRYLEQRLPALKIVGDVPADRQRVFFAAWIEVDTDLGNRETYRIVGADELDPQRHWISIDSPVAQALLGKTIGDVVVVATPDGERTLEVIAIRYTTDDDGSPS